MSTQQTLFRPPFLSPYPKIPKYKPFDKKDSTLGKRTLEEAFGKMTYDEERYGQYVGDDFFKNNIGHGVVNSSQEKIISTKTGDIIDVPELLEWCEKYLASKKIIYTLEDLKWDK
jgi:hypothetical protein